MRIPNVAYWAIVPAMDDEKFYMTWHDARKLQLDLGMGYIKSRMQISQPVIDSDGMDYMLLIKLIPKDIPSEENVEYSVGYLYVGSQTVALHMRVMTLGGAVAAPQSTSHVKYWEAMNQGELKEIVGAIIKYFEEKELIPKWDLVDFAMANIALPQQVTDDIWDTGEFRDARGYMNELPMPQKRKFKCKRIYLLEVVAKEEHEGGSRWLLKFYEKHSSTMLYWLAMDIPTLRMIADSITNKLKEMGFVECFREEVKK
jgi:hypothetical protein